MIRNLGLISLVVRDYEEAIRFYVDILGFELLEDRDVPEQSKRWVVVAPPGTTGANLLLARASNEEQASRIGNQTGGRVFLFLYTDDFVRDYEAFKAKGVKFVRNPQKFDYGTVAVFEDLYGNRWDLVEPSKSDGPSERSATESGGVAAPESRSLGERPATQSHLVDKEVRASKRFLARAVAAWALHSPLFLGVVYFFVLIPIFASLYQSRGAEFYTLSRTIAIAASSTAVWLQSQRWVMETWFL